MEAIQQEIKTARKELQEATAPVMWQDLQRRISCIETRPVVDMETFCRHL